MHTIFLVNPTAGAGKVLARLRTILAQSGDLRGARIIPIRHIDDALRAVSQFRPETLAVAVGGDGTAAIVAAALLQHGAAAHVLAVLPLGTGNIFARALGMCDVAEALAAIRHGVVESVDVMRTSNDSPPLALVSLSAGFEARFMHRYARLRRYGRGIGSTGGLLSAAFRTRGICMELDGTVIVRAPDTIFSAGLYNTPYYYGGVRMLPDAELTDGRAEAVVYESARDYWGVAGAALRGRDVRRVASVLRQQWSHARFESADGFQIDGEFVALREFSLRVDRRCLRVRVPQSPPTSAGQVVSREKASAE